MAFLTAEGNEHNDSCSQTDLKSLRRSTKLFTLESIPVQRWDIAFTCSVSAETLSLPVKFEECLYNSETLPVPVQFWENLYSAETFAFTRSVRRVAIHGVT
jgi:hypothetical protein